MHFCSSLLERSNKNEENSDSDSSTRFIKLSNRANPLNDSESDTDNKPVKISHSLLFVVKSLVPSSYISIRCYAVKAAYCGRFDHINRLLYLIIVCACDLINF